MDPIATLALIDKCIADKDRLEDDRLALVEHIEDLLEWLRKGGFVPGVPDWRGTLNKGQFIGYLNAIKAVAEMR